MLMQNDNVLLFLYQKLFPITPLKSSSVLLSNPSKVALESANPGLANMASYASTIGTNHHLGIQQQHSASYAQTNGASASRLNLASHQSNEFYVMYPHISSYARKSFGGNTQIKYNTNELASKLAKKGAKTFSTRNKSALNKRG